MPIHQSHLVICTHIQNFHQEPNRMLLCRQDSPFFILFPSSLHHSFYRNHRRRDYCNHKSQFFFITAGKTTGKWCVRVCLHACYSNVLSFFVFMSWDLWPACGFTRLFCVCGCSYIHIVYAYVVFFPIGERLHSSAQLKLSTIGIRTCSVIEEMFGPQTLLPFEVFVVQGWSWQPSRDCT